MCGSPSLGVPIGLWFPSLASAPSPRGAELTAGRSPAHPRVFSLENSDVSSDGELRRRDPPLLRCLLSSVPQVALSCKLSAAGGVLSSLPA